MLFVAEMHLKSWQLVRKCALQKALKIPLHLYLLSIFSNSLIGKQAAVVSEKVVR